MVEYPRVGASILLNQEYLGPYLSQAFAILLDPNILKMHHISVQRTWSCGAKLRADRSEGNLVQDQHHPPELRIEWHRAADSNATSGRLFTAEF